MANRPHIVLFIPDSYRADVQGHLGNPAAVTPTLDAFVTEGAVSYRNAFAQSPVCTPSRCSFMTGWYPHVNGHRSMRNMLKPHEPNLLNVLRDNGYHIWWGGKNDLLAVETPADYLRTAHAKYDWPDGTAKRALRDAPQKNAPLDKVFYRGVFDVVDDADKPVNRDAGWVRGATEFIGNYDGDQPYCLFLPLTGPHPAYSVEAAMRDVIPVDRLPPRIPASALRGARVEVMDAFREIYESAKISEEEWRQIKAVYYGMCTTIDAQFGEVIQAMKDAGSYDDTLTIFFSDHGDFAGDYDLPEKAHSTLQDALIHVPLLIRPPAGVAAQPGIRQHLTELVDISATIYDLLGIDPGYDHYGRSLQASLAGSEAPHRDAVFAEVGSRANEPQFVNAQVYDMPPDSFYARQGRASIPYHEAGTFAVSCRTQTHKYVRRAGSGVDELYDLTTDPGETHNLSGAAEHAELESRMQERLLEFYMQTADVMPQSPDSRGV